MLGLALAAGLLLGILIQYLWSRRAHNRLERDVAILNERLKSEEQLSEERAVALDQAETRLTAHFNQLAQVSLSRNSESFLRLARASLGQHEERAKAAISAREKAVEELVKPIRDALDKTQEQIGAIEAVQHEATVVGKRVPGASPDV